MWDQILGAMALLGMVVVCAELPKVVDAWCERIRGEAQDFQTDADTDAVEETATAAPAPRPAAKPTTAKAPASRTATA